MIVVWLFLTTYSPMTTTTLADQASCEAIKKIRNGDCVQVVIPAPSDKAYFHMPNKIGPSK